MGKTALTRRTVLRTAALATTALAMPFVRSARAAATVVPKGKMVLAWHTNIAARWLDPQQHDGTASGDNFLMALHDALIKNFREVRYDHPALAERFEFAEDAKSATFRLRPDIKFHDGRPVTPEDVKWSFEHYRGASGEVFHEKTQGVEIIDGGTVRFHFKEPFLDFPILLGTANVCGAGWIVPAKYYETVGQDGFLQKPIMFARDSLRWRKADSNHRSRGKRPASPRCRLSFAPYFGLEGSRRNRWFESGSLQ
jgi:peptide/nickel transport system substrate-binding protein